MTKAKYKVNSFFAGIGGFERTSALLTNHPSQLLMFGVGAFPAKMFLLHEAHHNVLVWMELDPVCFLGMLN